MTSEKIFKILNPCTPLTVTDMTPQEKLSLYDTMVSEGATQGFAYDRFFREGFAQWEIAGVDRLKAEYLDVIRHGGNDTATADYDRLSQQERDVPGTFWSLLGSIRHRTRFSQWMADRGMKSAVTVAKRFGSDDWKPFERKGIERIVRDFVASHAADADVS